MKRFYSYICIFLLFGLSFVNAQPNLTLTIENQTTVGSEFFFDIYFRAPNDEIYLRNFDLVLNFNEGGFTSDAIAVVPGTCTFTGNTPAFDAVVQTFYSGTANSINSNSIIINYNSTGANAGTINSFIAKITDAATHRLGTFKISTISNPGETMDLTWITSCQFVYKSSNN